jgi:O-antigen/teichoic acid export membrane protein
MKRNELQENRMNFRNSIKRIYSSEFFKYSAALLSSNAIAQIIAIIIYPFITRIYNPEVFGEYTLFIAIVGISTILATGKYESAIVLPKSEKKAIALFQLCTILNILFFILSFIIILIGGKKISSSWVILPFFVLFSGFWQTLNYFFIRQKKYYNISIYNISQSSINSCSKYIFGIKGLTQYGLILGTFLGRFLAIILSLFMGKSSLKKMKKIDKKEILSVAKIYSNFPKFNLPYELLSSFAGNLPILLLSIYFNMEEIGFFSLALTIGFCPVNLFSESVYQILYRKMTELVQNKEKLKHEFLLFIKTCFITISPFFILFAFISEWAFGILFGREWSEAGFYLKIMLPWLFLIMLNTSLVFIPNLFFKQKTTIKIEIIYFIFRLISLLLGIYFQNFKLAIILYCSISTFMHSIKLVWYFHLIKQYESSL